MKFLLPALSFLLLSLPLLLHGSRSNPEPGGKSDSAALRPNPGNLTDYLLEKLPLDEPLPLMPDFYATENEMPDESGLSGRFLSQAQLRMEELGYLIDNPLDLNQADADQLRNLGFLSEWQVSAILRYRESYGDIVHWQEIARFVPGLSKDVVSTLQQVCTLEPSSASKRKNTASKHQILARYGRMFYKSKAYQSGKYAGQPETYLFKYTFNRQNRVLAGFAAQQDAGEAFSRKGFDSYSGYLCLKETGFVENLVLGNFRIRWGYGVNAGISGSFYASSQADIVQGCGPGATPYASGAEYGYLQGISASLRLSRQWLLDLFYSNRKIDGKLSWPLAGAALHETGLSFPASNDPLTNPSFWDGLVSLPESGYHRSESERESQGKIRWQLSGMKIERNSGRFRIGAIVSLYGFGGAYNPPPKKTSTPGVGFQSGHPAPGSSVIGGIPLVAEAMGGNLSAYYQFLSRQFHFYGEYAYSTPRGIALLQGLQWKPSETFAFSALYQCHGRTYYSSYAACPNSRPASASRPGKSRETGQGQVRAWISPRLVLDLQAVFRKEREYPQLPVYGYALSAQVRRNGNLLEPSFRFDFSESRTRKGFSARLQLKWNFPRGLHAASLFESRNLGKGMLFLQDIGYQGPGGRFRLRLRAALFHTDGYENRLYAYEHDVLYAASAPVFHGKGCRIALLLKHSFGKNLWIEFKYAHTLHDGTQSSGSGDNLLAGFLRPEAKLQVRWKFSTGGHAKGFRTWNGDMAAQGL